MTSKVANGSSMGASRPPFRRQGSSIGGGVHPMTVALPLVQKVDYSVTKGGARTWAVLLVFMFLCSSLYTVFSAKEAKELAVDFDGVGDVDLDADVSEDQDDLSRQHHKTMRDTASEDYRWIKFHEEASDQDNMQTNMPLTDDDSAEQDSGLEHELFAGLRKKIERNLKRAKDIVTKREYEVDENEEKPTSTKRPRQRKNSGLEELMKDNDMRDKEEQSHEIPKRRKSRKKRKEAEEIKNTDANESNKEHEGDDEEEHINNKDENNKKDGLEKEEVIHNEEEKGVSYDDLLINDVEVIPQKRGKKLHTTRHIMEIPSHRQCRRKNCPPEYAAEPRKNLLKKKNKVEYTSNKRYRMMNREDIEEYGDELEENDEEVNVMTEIQDEKPVAELIAIKKHRSTDREAYKRHAITNKDDHKHRDILDKADYLVEKVKRKKGKE